MVASASNELTRNVAAASVAGACQPVLFNPLDTLRIRWQTAASVAVSAGAEGGGMLPFTLQILRSEGVWRGLYRPGLLFNLIGVAHSQGLRMGLYPTVRDKLVEPGGASPAAMAASGMASGSLAYLVSAPLFLLKTREQAGVQTGKPLVWPRAPADFWTGSTPMVVRGALLTAGQMMGYDGTKKFCRQHGLLSDGPALHVCAALVAALCAASFSAPADVLQTRLMQGGDGQPQGILRCALAIARADGLSGFFRGWGVNIIRLVPTFIVGSTIYEQSRALFGLAYLQ